ncbi:MAG: FxDxF family PEP-CTERM protein [Caulobacterales bacterium]|nr:FxDxF family PEP-CTERM protein [Caulobacterales bacterium]
MKRLLLAACALAAMTASAAHASTFVTWSAPMPDGSITANYGDTGIAAGDFTDVFDLTFPTGLTSFTVNSTFTTDPHQDINFSSVVFNGHAFNIVSTGQNEFRVLNNISVTAGGAQHLVITGTSGGNGSYDGVIAFTPVTAGVPEPAAWALMIMGFGGTGAILRRRSRMLLPAIG